MPKRQGRILTKEDFEREAEEHRQRCQKRKLDRMRHESVVNLDPTLRKFCMHIAEGKSSSDAASLCGYDDPGKTAVALLKRTDVRRALNVMIQKTVRMSEITREDVIEGFKDAIAIARQQSEAMGMIGTSTRKPPQRGTTTMSPTSAHLPSFHSSPEERSRKAIPPTETMRPI